ncbi:MAG: 16S rRNA (guanine(527)-N(7))-methyltransferase RsmG [Anaerolineaceae bacterium]
MTLSWAELPALFPQLPDAPRWLPLLQRHAALIAEAAPRVRVTAVPPEDAIRRQYAESLELLRIVAAQSSTSLTIGDVGSGGGFPGLVIAIVRPDAQIHLVEPLKKRAALLSEIVDALGLSNVLIHAVRGEEAGRGPLRDSLAVVTARALAELRELLEYTAPLTAPGGCVAFPKGSSLTGELAAAISSVVALSCEFQSVTPMRPAISATLSVAILRKLSPTAALYPRRTGVPAKRPL